MNFLVNWIGQDINSGELGLWTAGPEIPLPPTRAQYTAAACLSRKQQFEIFGCILFDRESVITFPAPSPHWGNILGSFVDGRWRVLNVRSDSEVSGGGYARVAAKSVLSNYVVVVGPNPVLDAMFERGKCLDMRFKPNLPSWF